MRRRFGIALLAAMMLAVHAIPASVSAETITSATPKGDHAIDLPRQLQALIAFPNASRAIDLTSAYHHHLLADSALAVLAVIALRRARRPEAAAALAGLLRETHRGDRRLLYEHAISHWAAGDCTRARPLLAEVMAGGTDAFSTEAALFATACEHRTGWSRDAAIIGGYDSNLGGGGSRRAITPEAGSRLDTLLRSLAIAYPGAAIGEQVTLGSKPVPGFWGGVRAARIRHWHRPGLDTRLVLSGELRQASRAEYQRATGAIAIDTRRPFRHGEMTAAISLTSRHQRRGRDRALLREDTLALDQAIRLPLPRHFNVHAGLEAVFSESRSEGRSEFQRQGVTLGLSHRAARTVAGIDGMGWRIDGFSGDQHGGDGYHDARLRTITASFGPLPLDRLAVYLGLRRTRRDYHQPRPWLRHPHRETDLAVSVTTDYLYGQGRRLRLRVEVIDTDSPDPFGEDRKWRLDMALHWHPR